MIPVTKPFLPPQHDYQQYVSEIWDRNWLTNNGPLVNELELQIKKFLNLKHFLYLANGTVALQIAIKALKLQGEIITTPFSYVATTSSISWEGCKPVFVDIDPFTLNIDANLIEAAITPQTSAILATHVYGNPCDIDKIDMIAKRHDLKVIYDAAHCFGTLYKEKSVFEYGDISTTSFHATKPFHTIEGGAVITPNAELLKKMSFLRNFGHDGLENFSGIGINGKNSEFHAAMGLCNLKYITEILVKRKKQFLYYDEIFKNLRVSRPAFQQNSNGNYAYYAIIFDSEEALIRAKAALERQQIFPRRYFYPLLSELDYVDFADVPVAKRIAKTVLCLPLYHTLTSSEQDMIARILLRTQNYGT